MAKRRSSSMVATAQGMPRKLNTSQIQQLKGLEALNLVNDDTTAERTALQLHGGAVEKVDSFLA
jgi:thymidine phosphorylase